MDAMSVVAATSSTVFCAYLERVLLPELRRSRPDAVLVMDNLPLRRRSNGCVVGTFSPFPQNRARQGVA